MSPATDVKEFEVKVTNFSGGINALDSPSGLPPEDIKRGENVFLDERGSGGKRLGCESHGTIGVGADRIISLHTFYRAGAQPQVLAHTSAGKLYYTNDPAANPTVWTQITGATGLSTSVPMSFETFNSKVYMCDGVSAYASWDGTTYVTFPTQPKGRYLRVWKDTMFLSGITGTPDRVYESDAGNAENFGVSSWVDIAHGDGDAVTALATDGIYMIVSKRQTIFVIYDPVSLANRLADANKGSESHFSWVHFDGDLYFLTRNGICRWRTDSPSVPLSFKLDPIFRMEIINLNGLLNAYGYAWGNRVGWAIPEVGQTYPTFQIEYFPRLAGKSGVGPFMFQRMPASVFTRVRFSNYERLYAGHNAANKFLQAYATVGTDDGQVYAGLIETGMMDLGVPARTKYIRRLRFLGRGKFDVQILRNFETSAHESHTIDLASGQDTWNLGEKWNEGDWGPDSWVKEKLVNTDLYGRYFAFRFTEAETNMGTRVTSVGNKDYSTSAGEWAIYGIIVEGEVLGIRE
jgi:hypothetical protein